MTDSEFKDRIAETFSRLLDVTTPYTSVKLLEDVLAKGSVFDVQVLHMSEGNSSKTAFLLVRDVVDEQGLTPDGRKDLEERLKRILAEKIDAMKKNDEEVEIAKERVARLITASDYMPLIEKLKSADDLLLTAGLGLVLMETEEYLERRGERFQRVADAAGFYMVVNEMRAEEGETFGDWYRELKASGVAPTGIVERLAEGKGDQDDVSPVLDEGIIAKPAVSAGRKFLGKFKERLRKNICQEMDGPYERLKRADLKRSAIPTALVATILEKGLSAHVVWVPIAVYAGLLIFRAGIETFCEDDPSPA